MREARDDSVSIEARLPSGIVVRFPEHARYFYLLHKGPTQPSIHRVPQIKRPGVKLTTHFHFKQVEIKNEWRNNPIPT